MVGWWNASVKPCISLDGTARELRLEQQQVRYEW